jgi:hypothetical protein
MLILPWKNSVKYFNIFMWRNLRGSKLHQNLGFILGEDRISSLIIMALLGNMHLTKVFLGGFSVIIWSIS